MNDFFKIEVESTEIWEYNLDCCFLSIYQELRWGHRVCALSSQFSGSDPQGSHSIAGSCHLFEGPSLSVSPHSIVRGRISVLRSFWRWHSRKNPCADWHSAMKNSSPKGFPTNIMVRSFQCIDSMCHGFFGGWKEEIGDRESRQLQRNDHIDLRTPVITVAVNHVVGRHLVSKGFNFLYPRITEQDAMTYYPNKTTMNISWRYVTLLK